MMDQGASLHDFAIIRGVLVSYGRYYSFPFPSRCHGGSSFLLEQSEFDFSPVRSRWSVG